MSYSRACHVLDEAAGLVHVEAGPIRLGSRFGYLLARLESV